MTNYVMKEREKEKTNLICILLKFTTLLRSTYSTLRLLKHLLGSFKKKLEQSLKLLTL